MGRARRRIGLRSVLAAAGLLAVWPAAAGGQRCPSRVWADEFEGAALDASKWEIQTGDGCAEGICGWGNGEEQTYRADNASVAGGALRIEARRQAIGDKNYTSARVRTRGRGDWKSGRFAARVKLPAGKGLWPAFWMLPTDRVHGGWPQSGEIDIMENIGSEPSTVFGTIHYGDPAPANRSSGARYTLAEGDRFSDDFHEFAVEKEVGVLRWMVDGVLYLTRTPADIEPYPWPFDERFHLILNLAVGGILPGSPDQTTALPQVLEVDWVRVWDGSLPHLAGDRRVENRETGAVYRVGNAFPGSTFSWTVPAGATIASGRGSGSITVDWGDAGGDVGVEVASGCGHESFTMPVKVNPAYGHDFAFESFDEPARVRFKSATGTLAEVANPGPSGVNLSALAGEYRRDPAQRFDTLVYGTSAIDDASRYEAGERRFYLDVHTAAPVGTEILIQLEDSATATPGNFPRGRHSRYRAFTTTRNRWQRLGFDFFDAPDPGADGGSIDDIVILFAKDSSSSDVFTFDNFASWTQRDPQPSRRGGSAAAD